MAKEGPGPIPAEFDAFALDYESALQKGLHLTGENSEYFADRRVRFLSEVLGTLGHASDSLLDFGCGTGSSTPYFNGYLRPKKIIGVDISESSLAVARKRFGSPQCSFMHVHAYGAKGECTIAFTNGVFHHLTGNEQAEAARYLFQTLSPGGILSFWENNPWNIGARIVMRRIPFDRTTHMVSPFKARALLREAGFAVIRTDYIFIFPHALRWLRWIEHFFMRIPVGGQYQVLCRKPLSEK